MSAETKFRPRGKPFTKGDPRAGRPKGSKNKATIEIRELARGLLEDPEYQASLTRRLRDGSAPNIEGLLYHYAYGKPVDRMELTGANGAPIEVRAALYLPANGRDVRESK